jgi:hypothetical protein
MSPPHSQCKLPTLDRLGIHQDEIDPAKSDPSSVQQIVEGWLTSFNRALKAKDTSAILSILLPDAFWRDVLALTWDIRSFYTQIVIKRFVDDRVFSSGLKEVKVDEGEGKRPNLSQNFPDLAWIRFFISFKLNFGSGVGLVRLVPTHSNLPNDPPTRGKLTWKAYSILTVLMELDGHPELLGPLRNPNPVHGFWPSDRERENNFLDREPAVLVVGAGQSGLDVAARLKVLGVDTVLIERMREVGQVRKPILTLYMSLRLNPHTFSNGETDMKLSVYTILSVRATLILHNQSEIRSLNFLNRVRSHAIHSVPGNLACLCAFSQISSMAQIVRRVYGTQYLDIFKHHFDGL